MITVHIFILFLSRILAKRKTKFKGHIKWLSLVDIVLVQNTLDTLYMTSWVIWCFFWDVYDRQYYASAGIMSFVVTCLRQLWTLNELKYVYLLCVFSSGCLTYASFYKYFELG